MEGWGGGAVGLLQRNRRRLVCSACQNSCLAGPSKKIPMDIERINLIGTSLADLTRRTHALRGYL
jgi:hypothetical protein